MNLFKRAAVRGIAHEMARSGYVNFLSKEAMDEVADHVADQSPLADISPDQGHPPEDVAAVAQKLMEIAEQLMAQAGVDGGAPEEALEGLPLEAKQAFESVKAASLRDYDSAAYDEALDLMDKAAAETKLSEPQGALLHGGEHKNTPAAAAQNDSVAALDERQRPQGTYQVARGDSALDTSAGMIGAQGPHDKQQANSPTGGNSITREIGKSASLRAALAKLATAMPGHGASANTPAEAAKHDELAKHENSARPEGYALVAPGGANFKEDAAARIGKEQPHPVGHAHKVTGSNSVIEASKTSAEAQYLESFRKTAADVGEYIPVSMTQEEKIATIEYMMPLDHNERQAALNELYSDPKYAGDISEMLAALKKKDKLKTEKKSSLIEDIRKIAAQHTR